MGPIAKTVSQSKKPLKGNALKPGDTVGLIALSAASAPERFAIGKEYLESLGFEVKVALSPTANYGTTDFLFSSASAANRAQALGELFCDKHVKAILSVRGAYGSIEMLPHFDFRAAKEHPKPLIGFSDTTAVLVALRKQSDLVTIHGAALESAFSKAAKEPLAAKSAAALIDLLCGKIRNPFGGLSATSLVPGDASGRLIGGNLTVLASLMGTPWEAQLEEQILFLEEIGEKPYRVHRSLLQMKVARKFSKLRGVLLGNFTQCVHEKGLGPNLEQVFLDIFGDLKIPIVSLPAFGHELLNLPISLGVVAHLGNNRLELEESPVLSA